MIRKPERPCVSTIHDVRKLPGLRLGCSGIHVCDIKPQNIMLDEDMTVKLSDFGIASFMATSEAESITATTSSSYAIKGSVGYVAPEYGHGGEVSTEGDVYSFGVVMLEVMTITEPINDMFGPHLTVRNWVSMVFQAKTEEEKTGENYTSFNQSL